MTIVAALLSAALGAVLPVLRTLIEALHQSPKGAGFFNSSIGRAVLGAFDLDKRPDGPEALFRSLSETSQKMDAIVSRIQEYTRGREQAVLKLERDLGTLAQQERDLQQRVEGLKNVPLPAAEYFASMVHLGERRSALRDYALFTLGVVVSAGVTIALKKLHMA